MLMINDVVNFLPHFLGIFPILNNLHFFSASSLLSLLLSFSLSLPSFSLSVSIQAEIIYWLLQSARLRETGFLKKPFLRRHLNSSEDKDMMSKRFHSQNKNIKRNKRCNLFQHLFPLALAISGWCEKINGMRPSFCEGSINVFPIATWS